MTDRIMRLADALSDPFDAYQVAAQCGVDHGSIRDECLRLCAHNKMTVRAWMHRTIYTLLDASDALAMAEEIVSDEAVTRLARLGG